MSVNHKLILVNLLLVVVSVGVFLWFYVIPDHEGYLVDNNKRYVASLEDFKFVRPSPPAYPLQQHKKSIAKQVRFFLAGVGLDKEYTEKAFALPKEVILGFSPYTEGLRGYVSNSNGHQILVRVPMVKADELESKGGAMSLSPGLSREENASRFNAILSMAQGCHGIYVMEKDRRDFGALVYLIENVIEDRGLVLYDVSSIPSDLDRDNEKQRKAFSHIFAPSLTIDGNAATAVIVEGLERIVSEGGEFFKDQTRIDVVFTAPSDDLFAVLSSWIERNRDKGIIIEDFDF